MFSTIIGFLFWPLVLLGLFTIILIVIDEGIIGKIIDSIENGHHQHHQKKYGNQSDEEIDQSDEMVQLNEKLTELEKEARRLRAKTAQARIDREKKLYPWKYESCARCGYYERKFYSDGDHEGKCVKHGYWWPASQDPPYDRPACEDFAK